MVTEYYIGITRCYRIRTNWSRHFHTCIIDYYGVSIIFPIHQSFCTDIRCQLWILSHKKNIFNFNFLFQPARGLPGQRHLVYILSTHASESFPCSTLPLTNKTIHHPLSPNNSFGHGLQSLEYTALARSLVHPIPHDATDNSE